MTVEPAETMNSTNSPLKSVTRIGNEKHLVAFVKDSFTKAKNDRWKAEKQWYMNLAFYFGKQNITSVDAPGTQRSFRLFTPPAPYYRARPIVNKIRPIIRTEMSKLTAQQPTAYIVPASSEDRDLFAANAGEQLWDSLYRSKKIHAKLRRAIFWTCVTGNGFIKTWWDENKVDDYSDLYGDICYEMVTPFHLFVSDLKAIDIEDQPWVIHAANRDVEQLNLMYGGRFKFDRNQDGDVLEESFTSVMGIDTTIKKRDTTLVLEMWVKPNQTKLLPAGGVITVAGERLLQVEESWPYEHNQYPFIHFRHLETGKFYADSVINDLIPLQREYNRTRGQIIEAKNRMAKPQLAAEQGSLDPNKITSEPGQIILYRPGFQAPTPIPLQPLPGYVLEEQDRIRSDMDEISGQHEVSRGQVPPGVTAATAISYLQEQDESKLSFTFDSIEEGVEKMAFQTLSYVKQYWDTKRKVKVAGVDGTFDVMAFEGSDLGNNTDIRVEGGSALPTSRAAKQAFIMDLMKMGFIEPNKGLEVMEIGGINKVYESIQVDVRQAQRENLKMAQVTPELLMQHKQQELQKFFDSPYGQQLMEQNMLMVGPNEELLDMTPLAQGMGLPQPVDIPLIVPVNTWDDHRIHIERHNNYRKSQAFDNLSEEAKTLFEDHVKAHVTAMMVGAQGAMQFPPEMMDLVNNPETFKEMEQNQQPAEGEQPLPGMEQM